MSSNFVELRSLNLISDRNLAIDWQFLILSFSVVQIHALSRIGFQIARPLDSQLSLG